MKRWLVGLFIGCYLSVLGFGLACHTLGVGLALHPMMYFVVWDMFCGWSAYANELHIVGEGVSGQYYELAPHPWGELIPYGGSTRHDNDPYLSFMPRFAKSTLEHTQHEPMVRIFVVEENWAKQWDLPDHVWSMRSPDPKDRRTYFKLRQELTGDCTVVRAYGSWMDEQANACVFDNPRLQAEMRNNQSFFLVDQSMGRSYLSGGAQPFSPVSSPLGH